MNRNWKLAFLPLAAGLALLAAACTGGDTNVYSDGIAPTGVSATGSGEAVGEPDVMVLTVGVSAEREAIEEAREAAAVAQTGVIDALKAAGVAERDIQTVQFNVSPQYDFGGPSGRGDVIGYVVSNVVTAKVRNLDNAGAAIDAATQAGGNDAIVQGISFGIDDPTELQAEARKQAVDKARAQAEQLASNGGASLGKLLSISESASYPYGGDVIRAPATGSSFDTVTPIEAGQLKIVVQVSVLYALE
jgi:hypothetical protein